MNVTRLVLLLVAIAACSKSSKQPLDSPQVDPIPVPVCEEPLEPACPRSSCGANSPTVNTFPTNGVRPDGECNPDGVQMLPGSVKGGPNNKCDGTTLTVRDNQLVTVHTKDGSLVCRSADLKGATFVLRSWKTTDGKNQTLTVHIADVVPRYHAGSIQHPRTAYKMTGDDGVSLCSAKGSTEARTKQLGLAELSDLTEPASGDDLVIAVRSELYDRDGHARKMAARWKVQEPEWLNFACVDDALAKRSLYDLHSDNVNTSRSALMMFMANYCGDFHATARGRAIEWEIVDDANGPPAGPRILEAKWGPDGAVCMSAPRELYQDGPTPTVPHDPYGDLLTMKGDCPGCTTPDAWANEMRRCQTMRLKHTPPPPRLTCEACKGAECAGVVLHSYVVPKPASPQ